VTAGLLRPCLTCGEPSPESWCDLHATRARTRARVPYRQRGYDGAFDRLSRRARARQPFCLTCHATENLTTDHLPIAWWRKAHGFTVRLRDVQVLCGPCNTRAGSSRPGSPRYEAWLAAR
jgi:5-methylcytosine-specific restriction protein A